MKLWYVAGTQARAEEKAAFNLRRQGFEVYLPRYRKRRSHARKVDWVPAPMFPRYLFVCLDAALQRWRPIRSTVGVTELIRNGDMPTPVPEGIVDEIRAREDDRGFVRLNLGWKLRKGDAVRVIEGAFTDQLGVFECADDKQRVFVLLDLLGRKVRVRLPVEAVAAGA